MNLRLLISTTVHRQQGAAIIEFALLLTLMVSLAAGIFSFGRAFWFYDALSKATRNAARGLSVSNPATIASVAVAAAKTAVSTDVVSAGLPSFTTANVSVNCLDSTLSVTTCTNGTKPAGVRVAITGYTLLIGGQIPILVGANSTYNVNLAPATTMPYMK
jgi:Flp pilus assembly protein TadG